MPSSLSSSTPPKPDQQLQKPIVNGTNPETCVNDVLGFISELYSKKSYMEIKDLFEDNKKLQAELDDEKSKCTKSMADLGRRIVEIGELEKEKEELTSENLTHKKKAAEREEEKVMQGAELSRLYQVVNTHEDEKRKLSKMEGEKKELEEEKKKLEKELERRNEQVNELNILKSYSISMSSCKSMRSEAIAVLRKICDEVFRFGKDFIYQELEHEVFHQERWEAAKSQKVIVDAEIPIPPSNSVAGKQMRFIAGIMVIGKAFEKCVFQPVYLNNQSAWLVDILDELDEAHEVHVRSVLLKALDVAQTDLVAKHAKAIALDIMNDLGGFVPVDRLQNCEAEIMRICHSAVNGWKPLQAIQECLLAEYAYDENEAKSWYPLRIPEPVQSQQPSKVEGNKAGPSSNKAANQAQGLFLMPDKALKYKREDVYEIWPAIFAGETPLYPGALVTRAQLEEAHLEVEAERSKQRIAKKKEHGNAPLTTQRRRRASEAFLHSGNGRNPGG